MPETVKPKKTKRFANEYQTRLNERIDELKWLYYELYHGDAQGFRYLLRILEDFYQHRSASLKALDRRREKDPDWYRGNDIVGMMLYVDNFADNLQGVIKKLDYFTESGVNYVHLMPLLQSPKEHSDGGYAVSDFRSVQPELGTMDDLRELTELCHERDISCCLDFVMNHTSDEHEWAKAARGGDMQARGRYFFFDSRDIPDQYEQTVPQVFPTTAPGNFTTLENGDIVMTTFYPYQWDLNYANPMVFNDMTANMLYLSNAGIDVIRLDHLEGAGNPVPQPAAGTHHRQNDADHRRDRLPLCPAARRGRHGAEQDRALLRHRRKARVQYALQRHHHGDHLELRRHPRRPPA